MKYWLSILTVILYHSNAFSNYSLTTPLWRAPLVDRTMQDRLYIPKHATDSTSELLVALHGCRQTAQEFETGSGLNEIADRYGFMVFYPQQDQSHDPIMGCWQWFDPKNQSHGQGEPEEIMIRVRKIQRQFEVEKTYVTGISSGGAMASILLSCYPQAFSGGAIHSGIAYGVATSLPQAVKIMKNGPSNSEPTSSQCHPQEFQGRVMVIHGEKDERVNIKNAVRIAQDFSPHSENRADHVISATGTTYSYHLQDYYVKDGLRTRLIQVDQLAHAWSGGNDILPFNDPRGPNAGELMWEFFHE